MENYKNFKKLELQRFQKAIKKTSKSYLKDNYGKVEFAEYEKLSMIASHISSFVSILELFPLGEKLFDTVEADSRYKFDILEGASRSFIGKFLMSKMLNKTLVELELDTKTIQDIVLNRSKSNLRLLSAFKTMANNAKHFMEVNEEAAKTYSRFTGEELKDCYEAEKVMLYTVNKAFKFDETFEDYVNSQTRLAQIGFEIIIIDGIDLYLKLSETDFTAIFNGFTMQFPFKKVDNTTLIESALEVQEELRKSYNEGFLKLLTEFLRSAVDSYVEDFKESYEGYRSEMHTRSEREKFIDSFENGNLFKE